MLKNIRISFVVSSLVALVVIMVGFVLDQANTASHVRELHIRTENETNLYVCRADGDQVRQVAYDAEVHIDLG
ncbi:hypothetical protein AB9F45_35495, partial [Rhizobium leguminosarum]|uniref:hypothetical protein n=1 Tax=Rhizobium leguminosarum TaxID=384 RepID=UPI003F979070